MSRFSSYLMILMGGAMVLFGFFREASADTQVSDSNKTGNESSALTEIVVTAQRRSESLERTPVAITVLTPTMLQERAITTESDLQSAVPGLLVRQQDTSNNLNYSIRGQTVENFTSSQPAVLPYLNEVPVTPDSATAFYDLQSVQVLKGPQGTLFGRNATGGAVLFTTAPPTNDLGGYIDVKFGDYSRQDVEGALNIPLNDRFLLRLAGHFEHRDGFAYNIYDNSHPGEVLDEDFRATLLMKLSDQLTNTLVVDGSHSGGSNTPVVASSIYTVGSKNGPYPLASITAALFSPFLDTAFGLPGAWAAYLAAHPKAYPGGVVAFTALQNSRSPYVVDEISTDAHKAAHWLISDTATYDFSDDTRIKDIASFSGAYSKDLLDYTGTPYGIDYQGPDGFRRSNRQITEELELLGKTLDSRLAYVAGLFMLNARSPQSADSTVFDLSPVSPQSVAAANTVQFDKAYAGYFQGTYDLSDATGVQGLGFTSGGRYTHEIISMDYLADDSLVKALGKGPQGFLNSTNQVSWQFGVQEQLNSDLLLYAVARHSFRTGGFNFGAAPIGGLAQQGGVFFKPEITHDVEVGSKYQGTLGGMPVHLNVALYKQWTADVQRLVTANVPVFGLSALTVNVPESQVSGVETDFQIDPAPWLNLGGSTAYTNARYSNGATTLFGQNVDYGPYPDAPRWTGNLFVQTNFPLHDNIGTLTVRSDVYTQAKFYYGSLESTLSPGTVLPGYTLVNFRLGLRDIGGTKLSLAAHVKNAFNRIYYVGGLDDGPSLGENCILPGEPRTFFLEGRYEF
jgi:iron complex outermembrane receptor protein